MLAFKRIQSKFGSSKNESNRNRSSKTSHTSIDNMNAISAFSESNDYYFSSSSSSYSSDSSSSSSSSSEHSYLSSHVNDRSQYFNKQNIIFYDFGDNLHQDKNFSHINSGNSEECKSQKSTIYIVSENNSLKRELSSVSIGSSSCQESSIDTMSNNTIGLNSYDTNSNPFKQPCMLTAEKWKSMGSRVRQGAFQCVANEGANTPIQSKTLNRMNHLISFKGCLSAQSLDSKTCEIGSDYHVKNNNRQGKHGLNEELKRTLQVASFRVYERIQEQDAAKEMNKKNSVRVIQEQSTPPEYEHHHNHNRRKYPHSNTRSSQSSCPYSQPSPTIGTSTTLLSIPPSPPQPPSESVTRKFSGSQYQISPLMGSKRIINSLPSLFEEGIDQATRKVPNENSLCDRNSYDHLMKHQAGRDRLIQEHHQDRVKNSNNHSKAPSMMNSGAAVSSPQRQCALALGTNHYSPARYIMPNILDNTMMEHDQDDTVACHRGHKKKNSSPKSVMTFEEKKAEQEIYFRRKSRFLNKLSQQSDFNTHDHHSTKIALQISSKNTDLFCNNNSPAVKSNCRLHSHYPFVRRHQLLHTIWSPDNELNAFSTATNDDNDEDDDILMDELNPRRHIHGVESSTEDESTSGSDHDEKCTQSLSSLRQLPSVSFEDDLRQNKDEDGCDGCCGDKEEAHDDCDDDTSDGVIESDEKNEESMTIFQANEQQSEVKLVHPKLTSDQRKFDLEQKSFFRKIESRIEDDGKWNDPENFPASWKKQMYEQKPSNQTELFNEIEAERIYPEPEQNHEIFQILSPSDENDCDSHDDILFGSEIEPTISLLTKIKRGRLGRFVKIFKFGRNDKKEKKRIKMFSRLKRKKEVSDAIADNEDDNIIYEENEEADDNKDIQNLNIYHSLGDDEDNVPKPYN